MNYIQSLLQVVEVGKGQILVRLVPLAAAVLVVAIAHNFSMYHGLNDAQSMDNAQLARQIVRGQGFTTKFIRPYAVTQLHDYAVSQSMVTGNSGDLFPSSQFPAGTPRVLPDTYNAPGYPVLLAIWFKLVHPEFDQSSTDLGTAHMYSGDRWIPPLNQIFVILTAVLVFALGHRLFDDRVAWMAMISFLATDLIWQYTLSALSTNFLMFLVTAILFCALEIFSIGEACFESEARSFTPAWLWALALSFFLAAACLTRLHLLILLAPLLIMLIVMPRSNLLLFVLITFLVTGAVTPWFLHVYNISGNPLGSNTPLLIYGEDEYQGNQIYCATSIPSYERVFKDVTKKECLGFNFHFQHAWNLLGSSPMILFFGASVLHRFKRRPTQLFQWLVFSSAFALIAANNLGSDAPETYGPWNTVFLLFPAMVVIGSAYFFILVDRLNLQLWLLSNLIVTATLVLSVVPLAMSITTTTGLYYNFPPYMPPAIKIFSQYAQPDEWVTTDMPWATAWYADRASLWLPDSIVDFQHLHDNVCPTGILLFTPITWGGTVSAVTTGEYKDWFPLVMGLPAPTNFPLTAHTATAPGGPEYSLWSDHPRWQAK